jgi:hypothetical protein
VDVPITGTVSLAEDLQKRCCACRYPRTDNCYRDYGVRNAQQMMRLLTSENTST